MKMKKKKMKKKRSRRNHLERQEESLQIIEKQIPMFLKKKIPMMNHLRKEEEEDQNGRQPNEVRFID